MGMSMIKGPELVLEEVAEVLDVSEDEVLREGLRALLERRLLTIKAQILEISGRYSVSSVKEMEARYRDGTLEEAGSWRDMQRLDHLEYQRDRLQTLLMNLG
jgi:hypothetical protein